jgi:hypothetical protein
VVSDNFAVDENAVAIANKMIEHAGTGSEGRVDVSGRAQTESIMIRALAPSARPGRFCPVRRSMHVQVDPGGSRTARERA